jgi:hypothetical protein
VTVNVVQVLEVAPSAAELPVGRVLATTLLINMIEVGGEEPRSPIEPVDRANGGRLSRFAEKA